ncbi:MAG: potassium channel protein [Candidatus Edwardsbacteria bacterium]|jgi:voltage-gated potassium channel|nr:potassium channel protein [Candidatus Edwardsbacteria bacterium]
MLIDREFRKILAPILLLVLLVLASSLLLHGVARLEGRDVTLLRSLYHVAITLSTVGYEDVIGCAGSTPLTLVNIALIFVFMLGVAYAVSNFTAFLIEGRLNKYFQVKKIMKQIGRMNKHYIICGAKDIGIYVARELADTKRQFVVIDESAHALEILQKEVPSAVAIEGDPTDDAVLARAGIARAQALVAALETDKENLYLVVAAKDIHPGIKIASRFNNPATRHKFTNAGAGYLVSPNMIGGMRIASELVRPTTVSFLDTMLRNKADRAMRVEEIEVPAGSPLAGLTLADVHKQTGLLVISCRQPGKEEFEYNPAPSVRVTAGMTLIFISHPEQRILMERKAAGGK